MYYCCLTVCPVEESANKFDQIMNLKCHGLSKTILRAPLILDVSCWVMLVFPKAVQTNLCIFLHKW